MYSNREKKQGERAIWQLIFPARCPCCGRRRASPSGGDGRPVAALAQQVEQHAGGVHHQLLLQRGQNAALQRPLFVAGVVQLRRLDDGAVPGVGAPQQEVRRHMVEVAGPRHEGETRLPDAVFIMAPDYARALAKLSREKAAFPDMSHETLNSAFPGRSQGMIQVLSTADGQLNRLNQSGLK